MSGSACGVGPGVGVAAGVGLGVGSGPLEMKRSTAVLGGTCAPAAGSVLVAVPLGAFSLNLRLVAPTLRSLLSSVVTACASAWPVTLGTVTGVGSGPLEMKRSTADLGGTCAPAAGSVLVAVPLGAFSLNLRFVSATRRSLLSRVVTACASAWPVTLGTITGVGAGVGGGVGAAVGPGVGTGSAASVRVWVAGSARASASAWAAAAPRPPRRR